MVEPLEIISLAINGCLTILTGAYVLLTHSLVKETHQQRLQLQRPNIVVDIENKGFYTNFVVRNLGNDVAHNIDVIIDPPLILSGGSKFSKLSITSLAPSVDYRNALWLSNDENANKNSEYRLVWNYNDSTKQESNGERVFSFEVFQATELKERQYSELTKELERITKALDGLKNANNSSHNIDTDKLTRSIEKLATSTDNLQRKLK